MTIKKQEHFFWLFPDTVGDAVFQFTKHDEEYKTSNGKKLDVFVFTGKDKDGREGDFLCAVWNIDNINELISRLGDDEKGWTDKLFKLSVSKQKGKIHAEIV